MAIAFDTALDLGFASTTTLTVAYTCTGSNRLLIVMVGMNLTDLLVGVTYNGVALTEIQSGQTNNGIKVTMWYLQNPASGSNNIVITKIGIADNMFGCAASYTGVNQSTLDSSNVGSSGTTTLTLTTTTVATPTWTFCDWRNGGTSSSAGAGTTVRVTNAGASNSMGIADSNGDVSAGSNSLVITTNSGTSVGIIASFGEAATSFIKTVDGLAKASVKTFNGLASASTKTWNGLS